MMKDVFHKDADILKMKRLFLFDMDGTIYKDDILFKGTRELLSKIKEIGGRYVFITNNSSKSVKEYIKKIQSFGISVDVDNFFTSTQATILYLKQNYSNKKIYCQGTEAFLKELREAGIEITCNPKDAIDLVLVGFDTELTSQKLRDTCEVLQKDVPYLATNPDLVCPVNFGFIPDCGSICQMIENATGKKPKFIGKPEATMVDIVREKFHYSKEETVVIGDRLYTDIASGIHAGVTTICVLTGEATIEVIKESSFTPAFTFDDVNELYKGLR